MCVEAIAAVSGNEQRAGKPQTGNWSCHVAACDVNVIESRR